MKLREKMKVEFRKREKGKGKRKLTGRKKVEV